MYRLVFQPHPTTRRPVAGDAAQLLIGREPECGLRLTEAGVHDRHAVIDRRAAGYFISDLTNSNGVHVNGTAITTQRLVTGDEIELGTVRLIFEVVHESPPRRRAFDPWQFLGIALVAGLVAGQLALFVWIIAQPHPRNAHTDIIPSNPPALASAPVLTSGPALPPLASTSTTAIATPEILGRMLKIVRVVRTDAATLRITIKTQVGDPQLDPKAITVSVRCDGAIQWLTIPANWENFKTKELSARLPEPCPSYIVRTYYRNQPQDAVAVPPAQLP